MPSYHLHFVVFRSKEGRKINFPILHYNMVEHHALLQMSVCQTHAKRPHEKSMVNIFLLIMESQTEARKCADTELCLPGLLTTPVNMSTTWLTCVHVLVDLLKQNHHTIFESLFFDLLTY